MIRRNSLNHLKLSSIRPRVRVNVRLIFFLSVSFISRYSSRIEYDITTRIT